MCRRRPPPAPPPAPAALQAAGRVVGVLGTLLVVLASEADGASSFAVSSSSLSSGARQGFLIREQHGAKATAAAASAATPAGTSSEAENVEFLLRTVARFKAVAGATERGVEYRHRKVDESLWAAANQTQDQGVRLALAQSVTSNAQSKLETLRTYGNMVTLAESIEKLLKAKMAGGYGCEQTLCGQHASCTETTQGAQCICNEGYVGNGQDCSPPAEFLPHPLLDGNTGGHAAMRATDANVAVFGAHNVAVVFRDVSKGDGGPGIFVVGSVHEAGLVDLAPPIEFTAMGGKAFDPVVAGTAERRVVVAWRDSDRAGLGWVRGGALGISGVRGADKHVTWGDAVTFAKDQAHKMSLVPLAQSRLALMFSDKVLATAHAPAESFGNAALLSVGGTGAVAVLGTFRFSDRPVCRLVATQLSATAFVVAARAGAASADELDPLPGAGAGVAGGAAAGTKQEALAIYGEMVDSDLFFDPNTMSLEPQRSQIWARGVSLVAPNTFAYAYQRGVEMQVMLAVVEVNPTTHRMTVVSGPSPIHAGFSHYVSMISLPYTPADPHTLTYFEDEAAKAGKVSICTWDRQLRLLSKCEEFTWLSQKLASVSGVHLGGGKSFMVFTTESGTPYYGVFGLSKK